MNTVKSSELPGMVGHQLEPTEWFLITQEQINEFADITLDHQYIHTDPERAATTPLGSTIAHGFLFLSMLSHFSHSFGFTVTDSVMGLNYGFDKVRFLTPVKTGSKVRTHATLSEVTEKTAGRYLLRYTVSIETGGENTPALIADWLVMVVCG